MRAIPTTYAGVEFRSRLEARTAMMLDEQGMTWHYEAEGFELSDGTKYLPDFWLPDIDTYIECKGASVPGIEKAEMFAHEVNGFPYGYLPSDDAIILEEVAVEDTWMCPETMVLIGTLDVRERSRPEWWDGSVEVDGRRYQDRGQWVRRRTGERYDVLRLLNALGASVFGTECPDCHTKQWVNIGGWKCRACGLHLMDHIYGDALESEERHRDPARQPPSREFSAAIELPRMKQWKPSGRR